MKKGRALPSKLHDGPPARGTYVLAKVKDIAAGLLRAPQR